jgi:hypothetical protein
MIPMSPKPKIVPPSAGKPQHILDDDVISVMVGAETGGACGVQQQETQSEG